MNQGIKTVIYPVKNLTAARAFYTKLLGVAPYIDKPYYVGFKIDDQEIGLDPNGHSNGWTQPTDYYTVDNIKESVQVLIEAGAKMHQDIKDVGGGKLLVSLTDADGNIIGLIQSP